MSQSDPISECLRRWGIEMRHVRGDEYVGPCPFCRDGDDRFHAWADVGNYWCRVCDVRGFLQEDQQHLSREELRLRRIEAEQRRIARKQKEIERRLTAIEQLNAKQEHLAYHKMLDEEDMAHWASQGIDAGAVEEYKLGICYKTPLDYPDHRPSYTIPVFDSSWSKLLNIRHRIVGADKRKYLPHAVGLPGKVLFNSRWTKSERELVLCEGEKKSIVVSSRGFPAVGILGKNGFNMAWVPHFANVRTLWIALDPDATDLADRLAAQLAKAMDSTTVRVCAFPMKPDDLLIQEDDSLFGMVLSQSRRVQ